MGVHKAGNVSGCGHSFRRKAVLLAIGALLITSALLWRDRQLPPPAPADVQASGRAMVEAELQRLAASPFGQSARGCILIGEIRELLVHERIVFSAGLGGPRGLTVRRWLGPSLLYLKVIEVNETTWLHQLDWQLVESLCHEALHFARGGLGKACLEEECDAFVAGLQAEATVKGLVPAVPLTVDGVRVAAFVRRSYPGLASRPDYAPVGETPEWLRQQAGL